MRLIPEAKSGYKLWSVQLGTVTTVLSLLEALNAALPLWDGVVAPGTFAIIAAVTGTATVIARHIKQRLSDE